MSLRFTTLPVTYQWPVEFYVAGLPKPQRFNATFRRLTKERITEIVDEVKSASSGDAEDGLDDLGLMFEVMEGWDAKDEDNDNAVIPFDRETVEKICNHLPMLPGAVMEAFVHSVYRAKSKNSKAS
jgi:hypothetical protein